VTVASTLDHPASLAAQATEAPEPQERLQAITALREELERLEAEAVRDAISAGQSWSQVAEALGISKQSAHRRHAKRLSEPAPPRERPPSQGRMVVTAQARRAVRAGRAAARAFGHAEVDTAHLLLGLMADAEGAAAVCLTDIGASFEAVRDAVASLDLPAGTADGSIPICGSAREALEQSLREAQRLGHEHLGVEHLLLALLRDEDGGAVRTLGDVGVSTDDLERCLGKVLKEASFSCR
jgi:Clp amino terminal domain, pathogenicity island component